MKRSPRATLIDTVEITVRAGDGGRGCESYRQERGSPHKRPTGGDGGRGGDVVIVADPGMYSLRGHQFPQQFMADSGSHGSGAQRHGANAKPLELRVPLGTRVLDATSALLVRDLTRVDERVVVARGGQGGRGNAERRAAKPGIPGEGQSLRLVLRLMADVALIGAPNSGKSSILKTLSQAKPPVTEYPYSSQMPVQGVAEHDDERFVVVDLPSLGDPACERFLHHMDRAPLVWQCLAWTDVDPDELIAECQTQWSQAVEAYPPLVDRTRWAVLSHGDLGTSTDLLERLPDELGVPVYSVSSETGDGFDRLLGETISWLKAKGVELQ